MPPLTLRGSHARPAAAVAMAPYALRRETAQTATSPRATANGIPLAHAWATGSAPWQLALVTPLPYAEGLSNRPAGQVPCAAASWGSRHHGDGLERMVGAATHAPPADARSSAIPGGPSASVPGGEIKPYKRPGSGKRQARVRRSMLAGPALQAPSRAGYGPDVCDGLALSALSWGIRGTPRRPWAWTRCGRASGSWRRRRPRPVSRSSPG
jgi:hypothetical protein